MGQGSHHTVPVVVSVPVANHHPRPTDQHGPLPFTGLPVEAFTAVGVALCLVGAAVVARVRGRRSPRRAL